MLPYFRALYRYSKMKKLSILGIIVMLFLAACNPNKEKAFITPTHVAKVRQLDSLYSHHVQQQQTDSLKTILLSDAILLTESEEETKGINAITEWYTNAFAYGMKTIDFTATDISGDDNHFIEIGIDTKGNHWLTIHTGSRNFGKCICEYWQERAIKKVNKQGKEDHRAQTI